MFRRVRRFVKRRAVEGVIRYNRLMSEAKPLGESSRPTVTEPLQAWCFVGADDLWALTADETGANLPDDHGPWRRLKSILLTGSEPDEQEAEALIREYGYCCFENRATE